MSLPLPPARRRHHRGAPAAALLALALVLTVAAAIMVIASRPPPGQAPGTPTPPSTERRVPARAAGSAPAVPAVSTAGWHAGRLDGTIVPISPAAGPRIHGQRAAGFADTPAGAVLAAVNIAVRTSGQLGPAIFIPAITRHVTGSGQKALLAAAWRDYASASIQHQPARPGGPAGRATAAARAFKVTSWTPATATVQVATAAYGSTGQGAVMRLLVLRLGGDWRLVAPPGGNLAASAAAATALPGFTTLPGRR